MKEGQELKDLNYTLRLSTDYTQRLTNFLFMPYTFAGPQRNGDEYETFSAFQTLIDLSYIEQVTGETLLIKDPNLSTFLKKYQLHSCTRTRFFSLERLKGKREK